MDMLKNELKGISLRNKIAIAFFITAMMWGLLVSIVDGFHFRQILSNVDLKQNLANEVGREFTNINIGLTVAACLTILLIALFLIEKASRQIEKLNDAVKKVTEGNLDVELDVRSHDEIGQLASRIREMIGYLKRTTTSIDRLNKEVSERTRAEYELRKERDFAKSLVETAQVIVLVLDTEGKIVSLNPYMESICGYRLDEVRGKNWFETFIPESWQKEISELFGKAVFGKTPVMGVVNPIITRDGQEVEIEWYNKTLRDIDGNITGLLSIGQDITARKRAEEALQQSNHELKMAAVKLEESNKELKDFVYIASHDLREPLRKISSFGGLLKESLEGKLSDDNKENMKFMIDGAERMTKMIEGLLIYSRVSTKEAPLEEVDLNEVVEQIKQFELSKPLEESGATIEIPKPLPKIMANRVQVGQLLQNLISNGIKYQEKGAKPVITIRGCNISDNEVKVEVQDNGIGIEEKYKEEIFKMFKRLHSRREYEGTGIGLSVCKKIVEKHNGKIGVESKPKEGSTFWFTMPAAVTDELGQKEKVTIDNEKQAAQANN
jgi:PAS domain S-box-containing protein